MADAHIVDLEEGWQVIKTKALDVLEAMIESGVKNEDNFFNPTEYVMTYTKCYDMCTQREPHSWSIPLYERHGESLRDYLTRVSFEAIVSQPDNPPRLLLQEYVKRWDNHKIMNKWYQKFFMYLDRYHIVHYSLPDLLTSGWTIFKEVIYTPTKSRMVGNMLEMIRTERTGESVNRQLLKAMKEVLVKMGMGSMDAYRDDFEEPLLQMTEEHFKALSQEYIATYSTSEYLMRAAKCLDEEVSAEKHVRKWCSLRIHVGCRCAMNYCLCT